MNREEFRELLRDLLFNIHDVAVLEKHQANDLFPRLYPDLYRAENLRQIVREGIEALHPREGPVNIESLEWRYYLILFGRYVEGESIIDLQRRLALGERQERRLHGRALSALENILWDRYFAPEPRGVSQTKESVEKQETHGVEETHGIEDVSYQIALEPLQLDWIIQEVAYLCNPRIEASGGELTLHIPGSLPQVHSDRIILRQIMLELISRILQLWTSPNISVHVVPNGGRVIIEVEVGEERILTASPVPPAVQSIDPDVLNQGPFRYWIERLNAGLTVESDCGNQEMQARFLLSLPQANQKTILVVDDHEQAIRIIQRFLNQTNIQAIGITVPAQVLPLARSIHPQAVLLDIMMPTIDGWELLQALKSDPETKEIPVIILSVWEQPDLAYSLGANGFLKKPVSQADLLDELARSNLLDRSGGSLPTGS